jgi:hypothetical protein
MSIITVSMVIRTGRRTSPDSRTSFLDSQSVQMNEELISNHTMISFYRKKQSLIILGRPTAHLKMEQVQ